MQITFVEQNSEIIRTGKTPYTKMKIIYESEAGQKKTYQLVSFANPAIFAAMQKANLGDKFDVTVGTNDKGYDTWTAISAVSAAAAAPKQGVPGTSSASSTVGRTSTYETPEERALKQRLIVRQSSLGYAIQSLTPGSKASLKTEEVFAVAEEYASFVYQEPLLDLTGTPNDLDTDEIPF